MLATLAPQRESLEPRTILQECIAQGGALPEFRAWDGHDWTLTLEGSVLTVKQPSAATQSRTMTGRGDIAGFTRAARRRCLQRMAAYPWDRMSRVVFITLTLHPDDAPESGPEAQRLLQRWRDRWEREFGGARGAWKREFTAAGVVHWHLWLDADERDVAELRVWTARTWHEVAVHETRRCPGPSCTRPAHARAGTSLEEAISHPAKYAAGYATRKGRKEYQHQVPAGFDSPGRWWGTWGVRRQPESVSIDGDQAVVLTRTMRRLRHARGRAYALRQGLCYRPPPVRGSNRGAWLVLDFHHPAPVARQLLIAAGVLDAVPRAGPPPLP